MHWLGGELERLQQLAVTHAEAKGRSARRDDGGERGARDAFLSATRALVAAVGERRGVTACFVAHDGLLADGRGAAADFEALAAVAQKCQAAAREAGASLSLGGVRQQVLVGDEHKLALFFVGQLVLGILAPTSTSLHELLGR